jgi:S-adenosylmethionine synthetase
MIHVEPAVTPSVAEAAVEVVEHKGIGHPDTICDALAEVASRSLCELYLARFGAVLHHNVDKALLVGGTSRPRFGGGELLEPIDILLAGRASPVEELDLGEAIRARCRGWLEGHLHALDVERHVRVATRIRTG